MHPPLRYDFPIAKYVVTYVRSCPLRVDVDEFVTFHAQGIKECALDATYTVGKCKTAREYLPILLLMVHMLWLIPELISLSLTKVLIKLSPLSLWQVWKQPW